MHATNVLKIRKHRNIYATKIFVLLIISNFSMFSMKLFFSNNRGRLNLLDGLRYIEFKIYSLSYSEFLEFHGLIESETSYELYSRYGGLLYLLNLSRR